MLAPQLGFLKERTNAGSLQIIEKEDIEGEGVFTVKERKVSVEFCNSRGTSRKDLNTPEK
jgi:hypothetical protein